MDHLITFKWINSYFFCNKGSITLDKSSNAYALRLRTVNVQWTYLIPLVDNFPLNTTKYLNYLSFKKVALAMQQGLHRSEEGKEFIKGIKNSMNSKRTDYNMPLTSAPRKLSPSWLIGFIEGDGSFTLEGIYPRILISLNKRDVSTLEAIKNYLPSAPGNINLLGKGPKYKDMLKYKVGRLKDLLSIIEVLNQGSWHTLKHYDYTHWVLIVMLHNYNYHKDPVIRGVIRNVFSTMNNNKRSAYPLEYKKILALIESRAHTAMGFKIINEYIIEISKAGGTPN